MNSNTSGLYAALGALEISPGDEIIVPPSTMSATVMGPLIYGAIPVFADIEKETFCLDIESVRSLINSKTKAIIAVNLFGHPAPLHELKALCKQYGLGLIEDNAQGPLASETCTQEPLVILGFSALIITAYPHRRRRCLCN